MSELDTIEAAVERRGRPKGKGDTGQRRSSAWSPRAILKAAHAAGFDRVRLDTDGQITVERGIPEVSKTATGDDGDKGEQNEWDTLIKDEDGG